jgi:hypothetical protein
MANDETTRPPDEGRRAYEEVPERRRPARRVAFAGVELSVAMVVTLLIVGVILGFGMAAGWRLAIRLMR